jgi:hypothetical protein
MSRRGAASLLTAAGLALLVATTTRAAPVGPSPTAGAGTAGGAGDKPRARPHTNPAPVPIPPAPAPPLPRPVDGGATDLGDAMPASARPVRVRLLDGSSVTGTVRAEEPQALVIECSLGILSIPRARIITIAYDAAAAVGSKRAPVQMLDDDGPPPPKRRSGTP